MNVPLTNILQALSNVAGRLFGKKSRQLTATGPDVPQTPPIHGNMIFGATPTMQGQDASTSPLSSPPGYDTYKQLRADSDQGVAKAQSQYDAALKGTQQPYPKPVSADPSPGENIASIISMLTGPQSPLGYTRSAQAPMILGQQRADTQNQFNLAEFNNQQKQAGITLDASKAVLGGQLDRQSALDRVGVEIQTKQAAIDAKGILAKLKADQGFTTQVAKMMGDGTATVPGISMLLQGQGLDPQTADSTAQQYLQGLQTDPSQMMQIKQAQEQLKVQANTDKNMKDWRATAHSPTAGVHERYAALQSLAENGDQYYATLTPEQLMGVARELSPVDQKNLSAAEYTAKRMEMIPAQIKQIISRTNLNDAQKSLVEKQVANFDKEFQSRVAQRWAQVYHSVHAKDAAGSLAGLNGLRSLYTTQFNALQHQKDASISSFNKSGWTPEDEARLQDVRTKMEDVEEQYTNAQMAIGNAGTVPTFDPTGAGLQGEIGNMGTGTKPPKGWILPKGAKISGGPSQHRSINPAQG